MRAKKETWTLNSQSRRNRRRQNETLRLLPPMLCMRKRESSNPSSLLPPLLLMPTHKDLFSHDLWMGEGEGGGCYSRLAFFRRGDAPIFYAFCLILFGRWERASVVVCQRRSLRFLSYLSFILPQTLKIPHVSGPIKFKKLSKWVISRLIFSFDWWEEVLSYYLTRAGKPSVGLERNWEISTFKTNF